MRWILPFLLFFLPFWGAMKGTPEAGGGVTVHSGASIEAD